MAYSCSLRIEACKWDSHRVQHFLQTSVSHCLGAWGGKKTELWMFPCLKIKTSFTYNPSGLGSWLSENTSPWYAGFLCAGTIFLNMRVQYIGFFPLRWYSCSGFAMWGYSSCHLHVNLQVGLCVHHKDILPTFLYIQKCFFWMSPGFFHWPRKWHKM